MYTLGTHPAQEQGVFHFAASVVRNDKNDIWERFGHILNDFRRNIDMIP